MFSSVYTLGIFVRNTREHELLHHYFALRQAVLFNRKLRGFIGSFIKSIYLHKKSHRRGFVLFLLFCCLCFSLSAPFSFLSPTLSLYSCPFVSPIWIRCPQTPDRFDKTRKLDLAVSHPPNRARPTSQSSCSSAPLVTASSAVGHVCAVIHQIFWHWSQKIKKQSYLPSFPYTTANIGAAT